MAAYGFNADDLPGQGIFIVLQKFIRSWAAMVLSTGITKSAKGPGVPNKGCKNDLYLLAWPLTYFQNLGMASVL